MRSNLINSLKEIGVENPRLEAEMIIDHTSNPSAIENIIHQRANKKPLDKILQTKGFYKYDFFVNEDVLSPRPDTEILVEKSINLIKENNLKSVLELGVGSGCVILSILKDCPNITGHGIDKSEKALTIARKNATTLNVDVSLELGDWFTYYPLPLEGGGLGWGCKNKSFDLIISNPPYIPTKDIQTLDEAVKNYDPLLALDGGADGLDSYNKIAEITPKMLNKNGYLLLEIGINQAQDVIKIFEKNFKHQETLKDYAGIERCLVFKK